MIKLNLSTTGWINNSIRVEMKNSYDSIFVSSKTPIQYKVDFDYELVPTHYNREATKNELADMLKMDKDGHHIEHLMDVITTMVLCWMMGYNRGHSAGSNEMKDSILVHGL